MSEEHKVNDIDEVFRKSIESLNTEPSDEFWRKSAEGIIQRGNKSNKKKVARWRGIAFILGAGLLLMGYLTLKMESGLDNVEKQMAEVKTIQNQEANKSHIDLNGKENAVDNSSNNTASKPEVKDRPVRSNESSSKKGYHNKKHYRMANKTEPVDANVTIVSKNENNHQFQKSEPDNIVQPTDVNGNIGSNTRDNPSNNEEKKKEPNGSGVVRLRDTSKTAIPDEKSISSHASKFSISAFFSPDFLVGYRFSTSGYSGNDYESDVKNEEKQTFSYTAGAKMEYEICSRISVGAGLGYQTYSFQIAPVMLYAHYQNNGDIGYNLYTSSGVVDCPYYGYTQKGDSLKMSATSSRNYLNIPVDLKFFLHKSSKVKLYIIAGGAMNISLNDKTVMNWETYTYQSGTSAVTTIEGLQNTNYSWMAGVGIRYDINNHFAFYAEPVFEGSITPISKNTSLMAYPYVLGTTTGITIHL